MGEGVLSRLGCSGGTGCFLTWHFFGFFPLFFVLVDMALLLGKG
jgi:hypothetical protein